MLKKLTFMLAGFFLLAAIAACGGPELSSAVEETNVPDPYRLEIIASNFQFDQPEYRVKAGQPIEFSIVNKQGHHGYEIEGLGIQIMHGDKKQYIIHEPGEYTIFCHIMCGSGHSNMKSVLIVE